jgi:transcriptional regulator with XRE-family HTH domain
MIKQKLDLSKNKPVLEQILKVHNLTYENLSEQLGISPRTLRQYRQGTREFRLNMQQLKVLAELLEPFDMTILDLPNDWILESES